jgi:hypothetical protein
MIIPIAIFKDTTETVPKKITITFATVPTSVSIVPAYYKYDKRFAMSWDFDDGNLDGYQVAVPLLTGGTVIYQDGNTPAYPGLFYTDGTGNNISFAGTFNLNMSTIESVASPTSKMNYTMLQESYVKGFSLTNHSYSNRTTTDLGGWDPDPAIEAQQAYYQIDENYNVLKNTTGIKFTNFTSPSNDDTYNPYTIEYLNQGKLKIVNNINNPSHYPGHQYTAEYWRDRQGVGLSRDFLTWTDAAVTRTSADFDFINTKLSAVGSDHAWFTFGTHRVNYAEAATVPTSTLKYLSFKWLMEGLASNYGATGSDNMWFTGINNVYEYLICARDTQITSIQNGNTMDVTFNFTPIPSSFKEHSLSLLLNSDSNITNISFQGFDEESYMINYKGLGNNNALVNIGYRPEYEKALYDRLSATVAVTNFEISQSQADLDIAQGLVTALRNGSFKDDLQARIDAVVVIPDALIMQVDFGRNISGYFLTFPWNTFGNTTPGLTGGNALSGLSTTISTVTSINMTVVNPFSNYDANTAFNASAIGLPFPYEACRDCFVIPGGSTSSLRLNNLNMSKLYDFTFYAARGFTGNLSQYTIKGTSVTIAHKVNGALTNATANQSTTVQILDVVPDAGGILDIILNGYPISVSNPGYINVIQITEKNNV